MHVNSTFALVNLGLVIFFLFEELPPQEFGEFLLVVIVPPALLELEIEKIAEYCFATPFKYFVELILKDILLRLVKLLNPLYPHRMIFRKML